LKSLLSMSKRVRFEMIQEILKVNKETLLNIIINWGKKNYCQIDGDYLILKEDSITQLIDDINQGCI